MLIDLNRRDAYSLEDSDGFERYNFDANVTNYGLADTFFPAFKKSVLEGQAHGIMCSYNALNGEQQRRAVSQHRLACACAVL